MIQNQRAIPANWLTLCGARFHIRTKQQYASKWRRCARCKSVHNIYLCSKCERDIAALGNLVFIPFKKKNKKKKVIFLLLLLMFFISLSVHISVRTERPLSSCACV